MVGKRVVVGEDVVGAIVGGGMVVGEAEDGALEERARDLERLVAVGRDRARADAAYATGSLRSPRHARKGHVRAQLQRGQHGPIAPLFKPAPHTTSAVIDLAIYATTMAVSFLFEGLIKGGGIFLFEGGSFSI